MSANNHGNTVAGTAGGTLVAIFSNIHSEDVMKTAVLALVGAIVSFSVSLALKWASKGLRSKR